MADKRRGIATHSDTCNDSKLESSSRAPESASSWSTSVALPDAILAYHMQPDMNLKLYNVFYMWSNTLTIRNENVENDQTWYPARRIRSFFSCLAAFFESIIICSLWRYTRGWKKLVHLHINDNGSVDEHKHFMQYRTSSWCSRASQRSFLDKMPVRAKRPLPWLAGTNVSCWSSESQSSPNSFVAICSGSEIISACINSRA